MECTWIVFDGKRHKRHKQSSSLSLIKKRHPQIPIMNVVQSRVTIYILSNFRLLFILNFPSLLISLFHKSIVDKSMQRSSLWGEAKWSNTGSFSDNRDPSSRSTRTADLALDGNADPREVQQRLLKSIERYKSENPQLSQTNGKLKEKMERISRDCEVIKENHRLMRMLKSLESTNRKLKSHNAQIMSEIQDMEKRSQTFMESVHKDSGIEEYQRSRDNPQPCALNLWDEFRKEVGNPRMA